MNALCDFPNTAKILGACALSLGMAVGAQAAPITGDPQTNAFGWNPNSTNALNFDKLVPGRIGQAAPYVLFSSNTIGSVILDFFNPGPGLAFFEVRIDDVETGINNHPVVTGDKIKSPGAGINTAVTSGNSVLDKEFFATSFVDIRLALGGERDWDFDWVRFEVAQQTPVPEPGSLALAGLALFGLTAFRRRRH